MSSHPTFEFFSLLTLVLSGLPFSNRLSKMNLIHFVLLQKNDEAPFCTIGWRFFDLLVFMCGISFYVDVVILSLNNYVNIKLF